MKTTIQGIDLIGTLAFGAFLCFAPPTMNAQATQRLKLPSGTYQETDDGGTTTLPSGEKFVSQTIETPDGMNDVLTFPNGQRFTSETAKGAGHIPYVSEDGKLVAIVRYPATQTHTLHIYSMEGNGKFKEIQGANQQAAKLLKAAKGQGWAKAAESALDLDSMSGHVLTLTAVDVGYDTIPESAKRPRDRPTYQFKVDVSPNGSLSLVAEEKSPRQTRSEPAQNLDLTTSLANGPSADVLEQGLRSFSAHNASLNRNSPNSGIADLYRQGAISNKVTAAKVSNEYARSIKDETVFVYDFDVEVSNSFGPFKSTVSFGFVKRGKKWYSIPTPN